MLISGLEGRIKVRSTKRLNAKSISKITELIGSFDSIRRYERLHKPRRGKRTFTFASLVALCIYLEIMG